MEEDDNVKDATFIQIMPSDGWRIEWDDGDEEGWDQPLVGWGVTRLGLIYPLTAGSDGMVEKVESYGSGRDNFRIYHPDARWTVARRDKRISPAKRESEPK